MEVNVNKLIGECVSQIWHLIVDGLKSFAVWRSAPTVLRTENPALKNRVRRTLGRRPYSEGFQSVVRYWLEMPGLSSVLSLRLASGVSLLAAVCSLTLAGPAFAQAPLKNTLSKLPMKIAYECYVDGNWEIFTMNADGSNKVNLTHSPDKNEHFPQISPDGKKIAYSIDTGEGRDAVRSLWIMDINGRHQKKLADNAREPFWSPDSKIIGFLPQEYPKFNVIDYYTNGMSFYHLDSGKVTVHPNSANIRHLYNPGWSPNGKWIVATVHGGMGFGHTILLIEANGNKIIDLKIPGCRPRLSPDDKHIAWGADDHQLVIAPINLDSDNPSVGEWALRIQDEKNKVYHINWSPDSKFVAFSRGPDGDGDLTKKGSFEAACEIIGVYAGGWNLYAVSAERTGKIDLLKDGAADFTQLTTNGDSNKQPAWFRSNRKGG